MRLSQLPNVLTVARIAAAPLLILTLKDHDYRTALLVFFLAGISDGLDGFIAKRWGYTSRLGSILDPVADKVLLLSAYIMLTVLDHVPFWLMLTVAFRDLLIVGGYLTYTSLVGPVVMHPSRLSKVNTLVQLTLVVVVLLHEALDVSYPLLIDGLIYAVLVTTVASGVHYLWAWIFKKQVELAEKPHG